MQWFYKTCGDQQWNNLIKEDNSSYLDLVFGGKWLTV